MEPMKKLLPSGDERWMEIQPLTFGRARIVVTDGIFVDDGW